jgi:hypothetical protein
MNLAARDSLNCPWAAGTGKAVASAQMTTERSYSAEVQSLASCDRRMVPPRT